MSRKNPKTINRFHTELKKRIAQVQSHKKPSRFLEHAAKSTGKLETLQWVLSEIEEVIADEEHREELERLKRAKEIERLKSSIT